MPLGLLSLVENKIGKVIASAIFAYVLYKWLFKRITIKAGERVVLVGASSGIGKELAYQYAQRGARLLLVARRQNLLEHVKQEAILMGPAEVHTLALDATTHAQEIANTCLQKLGGCDTLIVCMGVLSTHAFEDLCARTDPPLPSVMKDIFQVNVFGPMLCAQSFFPLLKESRGRLTLVSSIAGVFAAPTRSLYSATKSALNGFADSIRIEWKRHGISVTNILPGSVKTELRQRALDGSMGTEPLIKGISPLETARQIVKATDARERQRFIPRFYGWVLLIKFIFPDLIDFFAARKYNY